MRQYFWFGLVASLSLMMGLRAAGQGSDTNDAAVSAARTRQDTVKTLDLEFKQTEIIARGAKSALTFGTLKPAGVVPTEETRLESTNRLVLDGVKVRYENNHPTWLMPDGIIQKRTIISMTNGVQARMFFPRGMGGDREPEGVIDFDARVLDIKTHPVSPITLTFRGLESSITPFVIDELRATGVTLPIKGNPCRQYIDKGNGDKTYSFWLDPARDYVVQRRQVEKGGKLVEQCDIDYEPHEACGWVPHAWTYSWYSATGSVLMTTKVEISRLSINAPQSAGQFEMEFPPGCKVYDNPNKKQYRVESDGLMRELSRTGEELNNTVWQPGTPWYKRNMWLLIGLTGVMVLLALVYVLRRRRLKPT